MLDLRTQAEAAEALRLSERTLERMRLTGLGPVFVREKRYEEPHRADRRLNGKVRALANDLPEEPSPSPTEPHIAEANRPTQGLGI
jgi:hypothetical protein